jgi:hypothetical protein
MSSDLVRQDPLSLPFDEAFIGGDGPPEITIAYDVAWSQEAAFRAWVHEAQKMGLTVWDEPWNMQYRITVTGPQ